MWGSGGRENWSHVKKRKPTDFGVEYRKKEWKNVTVDYWIGGSDFNVV